MLVHKNSIYRPVVALTPQQKEQKKDYLLRQHTEKKQVLLPSWNVMWEQEMKNSDGLESFVDELKEEKGSIDEDDDPKWEITEEDINDEALELIPEELSLRYNDVEDSGTEEELDLVEEEYEAALVELRPIALETLRKEREVAYQVELYGEAKKKLEWLYDESVDRINNYLDGEDCWRVITAKEGVDPTKLTGLGIYWAHEETGAAAYDGRHDIGNSIKFRARIDTKYIDKMETLIANLYPTRGPEEAEVQFFQYSPIYVYDVTITYDLELPTADRTTKVIPINDWRRC